MAFVIIGALGFIWMGFWVLMYDKPEKSRRVNAAELEYIHQDDESEACHWCTIEKEQRYCAWSEYRLQMAEKDSSIQGYSDGIFHMRNE